MLTCPSSQSPPSPSDLHSAATCIAGFRALSQPQPLSPRLCACRVTTTDLVFLDPVRPRICHGLKPYQFPTEPNSCEDTEMILLATQQTQTHSHLEELPGSNCLGRRTSTAVDGGTQTAATTGTARPGGASLGRKRLPHSTELQLPWSPPLS